MLCGNPSGISTKSLSEGACPLWEANHSEILNSFWALTLQHGYEGQLEPCVWATALGRPQCPGHTAFWLWPQNLHSHTLAGKLSKGMDFGFQKKHISCDGEAQAWTSLSPCWILALPGQVLWSEGSDWIAELPVSSCVCRKNNHAHLVGYYRSWVRELTSIGKQASNCLRALNSVSFSFFLCKMK